MNDNTSQKLAATREDLARFQGMVTARMDALQDDIRCLQQTTDGIQRDVQTIAVRLTALETSHKANRQHQRNWREWLAYATTTGFALWSFLRGK